MAFSSAQFNTAISTQVYAPENIGFTHTTENQFVHFAGSVAGARKTFGLSSHEAKQKVVNFCYDFQRKYPSESSDCMRIMNMLSDMTGKVEVLSQLGRYEDTYCITEAIKKSGHIPLILSGANPAAQFERSTRSLESADLSAYFDMFDFARDQAREYVAKQDMMREIADFRSRIHTLRYTLVPLSAAHRLCNTVIVELDESVIRPNQASMPLEYEQFDLATEFHRKIKSIANQIDPDLVAEDEAQSKAFFVKLRAILHCLRGNPVSLQKSLSDNLYAFLKEHIETVLMINLTANQANLELDENQAGYLQSILPLIVYLNAPSNPFARNGLIGKIETNSFHEEALEAYRLHESKEEVYLACYDISYDPKNDGRAEITFDAAQISHLLFGTPLKNKSSHTMLDSMSRGLKGILSEGSANYASVVPYSMQRRENLSLPTPQIYEALEAPKPEVEFKR